MNSKRNRTLFIILFTIHYSLFTFYYCNAQQIKGALIGGINLSQVDGDQVFGYHRYGLNAGASAIIPLKKRFSVVIETIYSLKGSKQKPQYPYNPFVPTHDSTGEYELKLTYVEVPVLCQYEDKGGLTFGAGFSWGRLVNVKEKEYDVKANSVVWDNISLNDGTYRKNDWDVLVDLKFRIYKGLKFNARYSYSMIKIRDRYFYYFKKLRHQYNNFLSFRLIWVINSKNEEEKAPVKKPKIHKPKQGN
jgi:hypothetical protein